MNNILLTLFFSLVLSLSLFYSLYIFSSFQFFPHICPFLFRSLYSPPQLSKNITTISSLCFSNITEHIKVVTKDQYINYRDKNWYVLYFALIIVIGCLILMIVLIKSKRTKNTHQSIL